MTPPGRSTWRPDGQRMASHEPGRGVEEMDAVLHEDAAADRPIPEPVSGPEPFVCRQVLQREPSQRPEEVLAVRESQLLESVEQPVERIPPHDVVDGEVPAAPLCRLDRRNRVGQVGRQRLLAEDVLPGLNRGARHRAVRRRRRRDDHDVDARRCEQGIHIGNRHEAVCPGEGVAALRQDIRCRDRLDRVQVLERREAEASETAASGQPDPESGTGPAVHRGPDGLGGPVRRRRAAPIRESAMP